MNPESSAPSRRPIVLYDGQCPVCCRAVTALSFLDRGDRIARLDATSLRAIPLMATISPASRGRTVHVLKATGHAKHGGDAVILLLAMLHCDRVGTNLQRWPVTWTMRVTYLLFIALRRYFKTFPSWVSDAPDDNYRNTDWPLLSRSDVADTAVIQTHSGPIA